MWRLMVTHSILLIPLHFSSRASPCAITFQTQSTTSFTCFPCTWQLVIASLCSINRLVFITKTGSVYCAVRVQVNVSPLQRWVWGTGWCPAFILVNMLLLPGQTVEVREPPKKRNIPAEIGKHWIAKFFLFFQVVFKGLKHGISPITQTKLTQ
jgi:hypothetical protein